MKKEDKLTQEQLEEIKKMGETNPQKPIQANQIKILKQNESNHSAKQNEALDESEENMIRDTRPERDNNAKN